MVKRIINDVQVLVNPNSANEIYLDSAYIEHNNVLDYSLSPSELCGLITKDNFAPMALIWEMIDRCNFACPFCYIVGHSGNDFLPFNITKPFISELIEAGLLYCTLTGGESLLHKDFLYIYKFLKESGVLVEVYSNGYLINDEIVNLFKEFPPYRIEVSIYGVSQTRFNETTNTYSKSYEKVLENILKLKNNGINVKCKTPFNTITQTDFEQIGNWCRDNKIEYYYSTNVVNAYDGQSLSSYESNFDKMIEFDVKRISSNENKNLGALSIDAPFEKKRCFACGVKNYVIHINSNFDLLPCSEIHLKDCTHNIFQYGVKGALRLNREFINRHRGNSIKGCESCYASNICKMCPAIAKPIFNNEQEIIHFELPEGYCNKIMKKYHALKSKMDKFPNKL